MSKTRTRRLTPLESLVMNRIWDRSPVSVREVKQRLEPSKPLAYNTVLTVMRKLRDKGFLKSEREGRMDLYEPVVQRDEAAQVSIRDLMDRFFSGSASALVSRLIESEELDADEIITLRQDLDEWLQDRQNGKTKESNGKSGAV